MKIISDMLENPLLIYDNKVTVLNVSDKKLYSNIISQFDNSLEKVICFDDNDEELKTSKDLLFVLSPYYFDFESKDIQNKIISNVENNINEDMQKNII